MRGAGGLYVACCREGALSITASGAGVGNADEAAPDPGYVVDDLSLQF